MLWTRALWFTIELRNTVCGMGAWVLTSHLMNFSKLSASLGQPRSHQVNDLKYVMKTSDRRKANQLCRINMTNFYHQRVSNNKVLVVKEIVNVDSNVQDDIEVKKNVNDVRLCNSEIWVHLDAKWSHVLRIEGMDFLTIFWTIKAYFLMYPTNDSRQ